VLGKFLEFTVHTPDILESLSFYKLLGFHELEVRDTWPHKYAVVSDGDLCIGLHELPAEEGPALTFVLRKLAREARAMADHGFDFELLRLDEDVFNELGFRCRDNHRIRMIEARTFSRPDDDAESSLCGRFFEISLPVRDAMRAGRFWAPLAPEVQRIREEPTTHMRFNAAGIALGLSEIAEPAHFQQRDLGHLAFFDGDLDVDGFSICSRNDSRVNHLRAEEAVLGVESLHAFDVAV